MSDLELRPITDADGLRAALDEPLAVIYKHSPFCGLSTEAAGEVRQFMEQNPDVPVFLVDVIRDRELAVEVEQRFGIRHESPQVIVLRDGSPFWSASHRGVTAGALEQQLAA